MRVHFVIDSLGPGGAERSLAELAPSLADRGVTPVITCLKALTPEGVGGELLARGFAVRVLPAGAVLTQARALRAALHDDPPDLVHTTLVIGSIVGRLAAARSGVPVLTSLVNTTYEQEQLADPAITSWKLRVVQAVDGWTSRHLTTAFHAITQAVKASAVHRLGIDADRITVIERGRDPARLGATSPDRRARARASLGLRETDEVILNIGRQEYQKGQSVLIDAFERVASARPAAHLVIAGRRGSSSDVLDRAVTRATVRNRIHVLGHRGDVPELLCAADVFAFPSRFEGLGGSVIEAMALELPIVASDLPSLREVLRSGELGVLVPPDDAGALAAGITSVLSDPHRAASMGRRARVDFLDRFTLDRSADRLLSLYRDLVERQPSS